MPVRNDELWREEVPNPSSRFRVNIGTSPAINFQWPRYPARLIVFEETGKWVSQEEAENTLALWRDIKSFIDENTIGKQTFPPPGTRFHIVTRTTVGGEFSGGRTELWADPQTGVEGGSYLWETSTIVWPKVGAYAGVTMTRRERLRAWWMDKLVYFGLAKLKVSQA